MRAVGQQDAPDSVLNGFRAFMRWRKTRPALRSGDIRFLDAPEPVLLFTRAHEATMLLVAINLGGEALSLPRPSATPNLRQIECAGPRNGRIDERELKLPGHAAIYAEVVANAPA